MLLESGARLECGRSKSQCRDASHSVHRIDSIQLDSQGRPVFRDRDQSTEQRYHREIFSGSPYGAVLLDL